MNLELWWCDIPNNLSRPSFCWLAPFHLFLFGRKVRLSQVRDSGSLSKSREAKAKKSRLAMDERSALETISVSRQQQVVPPRTNESYGSGSAHTRRRAAAAVVEEESDERNKSAPTYSISSDVWRQKRRNIFALFASSSSSSPLLGARQLPCWSARH